MISFRPHLYFDWRNYPVSKQLGHHHQDQDQDQCARLTISLPMSLAITLALLLPLSLPCFSQQRPERTIDEIKAEAIHRAEVGQYPLIGLDAGDVKEACNSIHTRDKDE